MRKKSNSRSYFLKFRSQAEFAPWQARFSILPLFYICLAKALPRQKTPGQRSTRCKRRKAFSPLTPPWAFDRGFCLGDFIYLLTPAGCPPLSGRRCCSAAFSPGERKSGAALKKRLRRLSCEGGKAFPLTPPWAFDRGFCLSDFIYPLTPPWAFDRGFCLSNFIYPLTPAGCPPLSGRRCCSAAFSPGESKKRLPPLREPKSGGALKKRNAAAYPAKAEKLSPHAAVGVRSWFLLGQFYLPAHAGGLSAVPRSPVLLRRIFARREQKAAEH